MNMLNPLLLLGLSVFALAGASLASAADFCPRTEGTDSIGPPFPASERWYGSEAFAVQLPEDGTWLGSRDGDSMRVKLFWWSAGFRPGLESGLAVEVRSLTDPRMTARVYEPTNAYSDDFGGWTMLTGIEFPATGCWEISARYLGQQLSFVVATAAERERAESSWHESERAR